MSIKDILLDSARVVNSTLGELCVYTPVDGSGDIIDVSVIINRNVKVKDDYGFLAGYRVDASVLKSEIPDGGIEGDIIVEPDGTKWKVTGVTQDTTAKFYLSVVEF